MVVAYTRNRVIGKDGGLPWDGTMPADMRHFKELTLRKTIIMGRTTFESIGRALPLRQNIVLSRGYFEAPGIITVHSLDEAYTLARNEIMIIGGAEVYKQALESATTIHATLIDVDIEGDTFFPELDSEWVETYREPHRADAKNAYNYTFITYTKQQSAL